MASLRLAMAIDASNPVIGDLYIDPATGSCRLTNSLREEVQQLLYTRFRMFLGEWFLDPTLGTPWIQQILGVKQSDAVVQTILRNVIATCPGVAQITTFSMTRVGRSVSVKFACRLTDGTTLSEADFQPFVVQTT